MILNHLSNHMGESGEPQRRADRQPPGGGEIHSLPPRTSRPMPPLSPQVSTTCRFTLDESGDRHGGLPPSSAPWQSTSSLPPRALRRLRPDLARSLQCGVPARNPERPRPARAVYIGARLRSPRTSSGHEHPDTNRVRKQLDDLRSGPRLLTMPLSPILHVAVFRRLSPPVMHRRESRPRSTLEMRSRQDG